MSDLTPAMRDLLCWMKGRIQDGGTFRGRDLMTARALERRGLVEPLGYEIRSYALTNLGRETAVALTKEQR